MQEDLPYRLGNVSRGQPEDVAQLIKFIDDNIIGKGNSFCGPYGRRKGELLPLNCGHFIHFLFTSYKNIIVKVY